jgi:hypothetical protein
MATLNAAQIKTKMGQVPNEIIEGTKYFTTATASVEKNGLPADRAEVDRMFTSGRMRHDKVHNAFTECAQNDKELAKNYPKIVEAKKSFSTKWADYRKLLGK